MEGFDDWQSMAIPDASHFAYALHFRANRKQVVST
jgi:hypothetical protein